MPRFSPIIALGESLDFELVLGQLSLGVAGGGGESIETE